MITGRVADPSLFLGAARARVRLVAWTTGPRLGRGTLVGHLLECAGQITGGYFADPGCKDVRRPRAGSAFRSREVAEDGTAVITKVPGSGGRVTPATCKEQLLYEIHDPVARTSRPTSIADFSRVRMTRDRVSIASRCDGATGRERPDTLKVSLGYLDGFIGEGQISLRWFRRAGARATSVDGRQGAAQSSRHTRR